MVALTGLDVVVLSGSQFRYFGTGNHVLGQFLPWKSVLYQSTSIHLFFVWTSFLLSVVSFVAFFGYVGGRFLKLIKIIRFSQTFSNFIKHISSRGIFKRREVEKQNEYTIYSVKKLLKSERFSKKCGQERMKVLWHESYCMLILLKTVFYPS